jgi:hypothetical protein
MDRISKTSLLSTKKKMPKECENAYPPQNTAGFSDFPEKLRNRWFLGTSNHRWSDENYYTKTEGTLTHALLLGLSVKY